MEKEIKTCEIKAGFKGFGYLSEELINKMIIEFKRAGHVLTDICVTQKDVDDVNGWAASDMSEEEQEEIFNDNSILDINIHLIEGVEADTSIKSRIIGFDFTANEMSEDQKLSRAKEHLSGSNSEVFCIGAIDRLNK